jgi:hypothetical protein
MEACSAVFLAPQLRPSIVGSSNRSSSRAIYLESSETGFALCLLHNEIGGAQRGAIIPLCWICSCLDADDRSSM